MNPDLAKTARSERVQIQALSPPKDVLAELEADVRAGFAQTPKTLAPKYFYDGRGSELFVEITRTEEYYPTRAETALLEAHADELFPEGEVAELLEIGSGASRKTQALLEALHRRGGSRYVAFDVSEDAVRDAATRLTSQYGWLEVLGLIGDFHTDLGRIPGGERRLVAFLGSTLGNLERHERRTFLRDVARMLRPGDAFLLGVDLVKDPRVLEAAYNDAAGVTAEFNRNLLHVLNRELEGDLPVEAFEHVATYDRERRRIVSRLRASRAVQARLGRIDLLVEFAAGEELFTEISAKFERRTLSEELAEAGLEIERWIESDGGVYGMALIHG